MDVGPKNHMVYDPIYGFIRLTPVEWEVIHSPFYQRLRWIKQLGFSSYVFYGAEHSRFGHSIGVMYNAHKILESCGRSCPPEELYSSGFKTQTGEFHKSVRLAALMHDLGTFPFSHTTEGAYTRQTSQKSGNSSKSVVQDHEKLGSLIINNTNYPQGITHILKKFGFDPGRISKLVKGQDKSILANQILHSEIDCDRMDYLLRDAHYTGLKYGTYDRDYLLHHFQVYDLDGTDILTIKSNALHCVEDFLMARFAWYSQVIRSSRGAKFDALAEEIWSFLLKEKFVFSFNDLENLIQSDPYAFFEFHDSYFMNRVFEIYRNERFKSNTKIMEIAEILINQKSPKVIRCPEFQQRLLNQDENSNIDKYIKKAMEKVQQIEECLKKKGGQSDWIVVDIPQKNIVFVNSYKSIIKNKTQENVLMERDPVKILNEKGSVSLLGEIQNSIISKLQNSFNFIPNVFCSESAYQVLIDEGIIKD